MNIVLKADIKKGVRNLVLHGLNVGLALALMVSTAAAQGDVAQGKLLFESRCPLCHQVPEPSMLRLDPLRTIPSSHAKAYSAVCNATAE